VDIAQDFDNTLMYISLVRDINKYLMGWLSIVVKTNIPYGILYLRHQGVIIPYGLVIHCGIYTLNITV
jgi:hypothetical protein